MSKKLFILLVLLFSFLLPSLSFTPWPEMLARPFYLNNGWLPYKDFVMEHSPLLPVVLAGWYKFVGLGILQLKIFTWLVLFTTAFLVYRFSAKNFSLPAARIASIAYLFLALAYEGNGIWFDLALAPVIFSVFWLATAGRGSIAGLSFGLAFLIKQTTVWFVLPLSFLFYKHPKTLLKFILGLAVVMGITLILFYYLGIFSDFLHWAIRPIAAYQFPLPQQLVYFAPLVVLFLRSSDNHELITKLRLFAVFGIAGILPRWGLFHFQPGLPFLAALIGVFLTTPNNQLSKLFLTAVLLTFISRQISQIWLFPDRFSEKPFLASVDYVKNNSSVTDKILVLNTWESLYALSDRLPASRPLYPYLPWFMDQPGVQEQVVSTITATPPKLIIVGETQSEGLGEYIPEKLNSVVLKNFVEKTKIGFISIYAQN